MRLLPILKRHENSGYHTMEHQSQALNAPKEYFWQLSNYLQFSRNYRKSMLVSFNGSFFSKGFAILVSKANFALNFLQTNNICISHIRHRLEKSGNFESAKYLVISWLLKMFHSKRWIFIEIKLPLHSTISMIFLTKC